MANSPLTFKVRALTSMTEKHSQNKIGKQILMQLRDSKYIKREKSTDKKIVKYLFGLSTKKSDQE